ncbi:MAG: molybdenum cofactor biosynthesis protein MoaE [Acidimicrobiia bacterium]
MPGLPDERDEPVERDETDEVVADATQIALTREPLPVAELTDWATTPGSGAVVMFLGVVRDHADGRVGVTGLSYEAYEEAAAGRLAAVAGGARARWPEVQRIALVHRLGDLALSEASVLVVVSAPHRGVAFDAARFCIDTLKETVPIWKREHWSDGSAWSDAARPVTSVSPHASGPHSPAVGSAR